MDDERVDLECHFHGFTQLYPTAADHPTPADIIAITGLDGHAFGCWRGKGNLGRIWLFDFFRKDLPNCRTILYGNNLKLMNNSIDEVLDYGRGFLVGIKRIRGSTELHQGPLLFIAHSVSSIIITHCLVKAVFANKHGHPEIAALHKSTYGTLFFGTLHKGLVIDDRLKLIGRGRLHPCRGLLEQVKKCSTSLMSKLVDFKNTTQNYQIVSFHETRQNRQLEHNPETGNWGCTGEFITTVDSESALLQLPEVMEVKIKVDTDYTTIVKYDNIKEPIGRL